MFIVIQKQLKHIGCENVVENEFETRLKCRFDDFEVQNTCDSIVYQHV